MSYGTQSVRFNGSTATFHRNKRAALKGFVYVNGRRVYGHLHTDVAPGNAPVFLPNTVLAEAVSA